MSPPISAATPDHALFPSRDPGLAPPAFLHARMLAEDRFGRKGTRKLFSNGHERG